MYEGSNFSTSLPTFIFSYFYFWITAILVGVKWDFIVVLTCSSLMTNNVDHLFMCLLDICIPSLEKCLCKLFAFLKTGLFLSLLLSCKSSLYILDTRSLSDTWFENIFSHSIGCLFIFLIVSFEAQKFTIWMNFNLCTFSFWCLCLVPYLKNHYLIPGHKDLCLRFLLKVLALPFIPSIHFELFDSFL